MPYKGDMEFLYNLVNNLQKEFNQEFKNQAKLLLGLSSGVLTLLISQSKNLPDSELFFYIYLTLLISIISGIVVQYFYVIFIRSQTRKVNKSINEIENSTEKQKIYTKLRKEIYDHPSVFWLKICSNLQTFLFLVGFLLLSKIVLWP